MNFDIRQFAFLIIAVCLYILIWYLIKLGIIDPKTGKINAGFDSKVTQKKQQKAAEKIEFKKIK